MKTKKDLNRIANSLVKVANELKLFNNITTKSPQTKQRFVFLNQKFVDLQYKLNIAIKNKDDNCKSGQKWFNVAEEYKYQIGGLNEN